MSQEVKIILDDEWREKVVTTGNMAVRLGIGK